jgi:Zn finger protein HypA/HybF involved in hydrogenase expression
MTTRDDRSAPGRSASQTPPRLFECKLCGKVFDAREAHPTCTECDSRDVEQVG